MAGLAVKTRTLTTCPGVSGNEVAHVQFPTSERRDRFTQTYLSMFVSGKHRRRRPHNDFTKQSLTVANIHETHYPLLANSRHACITYFVVVCTRCIYYSFTVPAGRSYGSSRGSRPGRT